MKKTIYFILINMIVLFFYCSCYAQELSNDANLKSLNFSDGILSPSFNENITSYTLTIDEKIKSVNINATCNNCQKLSGIGNIKVSNGTNSKKIKVVAEDGKNKKVYSIFITKKNSEVSYDNNDYPAELKKIKIKGYKISPEFNKLNTNYTVIINKDEDKLDIECVAVDKDATVKIIGNENLHYKENIINIEVKNRKNIQNYILRVYKEKNIKQKVIVKNPVDKKRNSKYLGILIITISLLIILLSWYFLFIYKKKK